MERPQTRQDRSRPLADLLLDAGLDAAVAGRELVSGVTADSRRVRPGDLFVAIRGTEVDAHEFVRGAVGRGAAAVVVEAPCPDVPVPCVRTDDARRALAALAAAWFGRPAERLSLIGITGTVGKTSVLMMLEALFAAGGRRLGTIGSLGIRTDGETRQTGLTAPDPLQLHQGLADMLADGCDCAAMEVTSHALAQRRVHGIELDLGIFTNLVPLEHSEFHGSFRGYVEAKARFFDHLRPGALLVHNADDRAVRRLARGRDLTPVGVGTGPRTALVAVEIREISRGGTRFRLRLRRPLPLLTGGETPPRAVDLDLKLLGRSNVYNASLAAVTAMCMGIGDPAVREGLGRLEAPRRRMEILHDGDFLVVDDTVGHPDSVSALFEVVERLDVRQVHAVFAVRGKRGPRINRQTAEALAIWAQRRPLATLVVTRSDDAADERNRVSKAEEAAFLAPLRDAGLRVEQRATLREAVPAALRRARENDLVLLLGAQGMDAGAERAREWLAAR
jgi:UDP-N-acetylmuramoyl-L-alanyl-D-glutamate--2,6-diaminopimelate ligase